MLRTRVKICGLTRPEDALEAASLGVDAIGLVFYDKSPRQVSLAQAQAICSVLPPFVSKVGLFVNADQDFVSLVRQKVSLDYLQFHGNESEADCVRYQMPYIKAIRVNADTALQAVMQQHQQAQAFLFDTYVDGVAGGTGSTFDWHLLNIKMDKPVILAGGLQAQNVRQAIKQVQPYAVDVSGGVESSKGIKDHQMMKDFIQAVRNT